MVAIVCRVSIWPGASLAASRSGAKRESARLLQARRRAIDCAIDPSQEIRLGNRLWQPGDNAGPIHAFARWRGPHRGDHDGALRRSAFAESLDEFQSVHSGHLEVDNEAVEPAQRAVCEQRVRRGEVCDLETMRFKERAERIAHGFIVFYDTDCAQGWPLSPEASSEPERRHTEVHLSVDDPRR